MLGVLAGAGSGPTAFGFAGFEGSVGVRRPLRLGVEAGAWFNGPVACIDRYPDSERCNTSGSGYLAYAQLVPVRRPVAPTIEALAGVYVRRDAGGLRDGSPAVGGALGLRLGDARGVAGHLAVRYLRAYDRPYERLLGERLHFKLLTLGVQHFW